MFKKLRNFWNKHGYEIAIGLSLLIIIIYAIVRRNKKGTRTPVNLYMNDISKKPSINRPSPPKESRGELECRRVLQKLFKRPFDKARPDFLRNPVTGNLHNLELDCYDAILNLAIEYSGVQHYKFTPYMHRNKEAFRNQQYRDYMKATMCKENGINLIVVPYTVKLEDIEGYLVRELKRLNYLK